MPEISLVIAVPRAPKRAWWRPRPKVDLRTLAMAVACLQVAEGMALHAQRDGCFVHAFTSSVTRRRCLPLIPARFRRDREWMHRHIEAPGMRLQARVDDEWARQ